MLHAEKRNQNGSHQRSCSQLPVRYRLGGPVFSPSRTLDVSPRGMRLEVCERPLPGQAIALSVPSENLGSIQVRGKVAWFSHSWKPGTYEVGVELLPMGRCDALQWKQQLKSA